MWEHDHTIEELMSHHMPAEPSLEWVSLQFHQPCAGAYDIAWVTPFYVQAHRPIAADDAVSHGFKCISWWLKHRVAFISDLQLAARADFLVSELA